jgi:hypothetical protein
VIEDAPAGVRAGKSAGMTVLGISSTHSPGELAEADDVVGSLAEAAPLIVRWLDGHGPIDGRPPARGTGVRSADGHLQAQAEG